MRTYYEIECVTIDTDGTNDPDLNSKPRMKIVWSGEDHDMCMHYWMEYASGCNDEEGAHSYASYFAFPAKFYRIVERESEE